LDPDVSAGINISSIPHEVRLKKDAPRHEGEFILKIMNNILLPRKDYYHSCSKCLEEMLDRGTVNLREHGQ
jgi:hypothetical protein